MDSEPRANHATIATTKPDHRRLCGSVFKTECVNQVGKVCHGLLGSQQAHAAIRVLREGFRFTLMDVMVGVNAAK